MNELSDDEVMTPAKGEMSDADVMAPPAAPESTALPAAFLQRLRVGAAFVSAYRRINAAAFGAAKEPLDAMTPTGLSDETLNRAIDAGWFHDPASGKPGPLQFATEALAIPAAQITQGIFGGINAGLHGAAGALGQLYDEIGSPHFDIENTPIGPIRGGGTGEQLKREVINAGNWAMIEAGMGRFHRAQLTPAVGPLDEPIGPLPTGADFKTGAAQLGSEAAEANLRRAWEEQGLHPAEAVADAQRDAFVRHDLTTPARELPDTSGIPAVRGGPPPIGVPRSELAKTGEAHIDALLESVPTKQVIDSPIVDREHTIPYTAGGSVPLEDPTFFIDRRFPQSFTIDGITFDPADPFSVHENVEQHAMEALIKGGMDQETAYRVSHFEFAEKAEGAWYRGHGIDQAKAEAAYAPFMAAIQHEFVGPSMVSGSMELLHGYNKTAAPFSGFKSLSEVPDKIRYDGGGGAFGKYTYLDPTGRWLAGDQGALGNDAAVRVRANFDKLFVLTPESVGDLARVVGKEAINSGLEISARLEAQGYDGIQVRGFDGIPSEAKGRLKIDGDILQDQVVSFKPDKNLQVVGSVDLPDRPPFEATEQEREAFFDARRRAIFSQADDLGKLIQREPAGNVPSNLYKRPYPHDNPSAAMAEPIAEPRPTAADITRAKEILDRAGLGQEGQARSLGAAAADLPPDTPPSQQPLQRPGRLAAAYQAAAAKAFDLTRDLQMNLAPMAAGTKDSMAILKDFANALRRNRWEWSRTDTDIAKRFTPEQRARMWNAADEESVALQTGESREHQGLTTLTAEERQAVEDLQTRAQLAWGRAKDLGMVQGEGLPAYTPRMIINAAQTSPDGSLSLNAMGRNLKVSTSQMLHRKHLTAEETEAAAKERLGEDAVIARDIRALPLATARLEDAIAGRTLINRIKEYGANTGDETVAEGFKPGPDWFTMQEHPAFRTWRPKFETDPVTGKTVAAQDDKGNAIFQQVPIYVRGDFEGPLRAVLTKPSGPIYGAAMALKGKTMGLIMNSPLIHNAVEWGRALPAMPGKVATFRVYFQGNRLKNDPVQMGEAIDHGLVPIGKRFFNQDITSIMEEPNLAPGRSWTAQVLGFVPGLFDEGAGNAVKAAIDKAGDFWHNTLLWDRVGDLQMGLYGNFRDSLLAKGVDRDTASYAAAHWANRYAGALPQEAMSDGARKIANLLLFSRSFTMGNLGAMKDMLTGLPRDVLAQIERDGGFPKGAIEGAEPAAKGAPEVAQFAKSMARRKAMAIVALDMGLMYVGNSLLQNAMNVMLGDSTFDKEMHGYAARFSAKMQEVRENPMELLQPFDFLQSLSATAENEPNREDRIMVGHAADGTAIYARNPTGKIGEEFVGWGTAPLDMIRRKLGTIARPVWQIMANDKGFGRKVYDPNADTPAKYLANLGRIAAHIAGSQLPEGQISGFSDLVKGEGDPKVNALQAFGPVAGVTFAKGAPGGPAVGELYQAHAMHQYAVDAALPDIRRQIQRGDLDGAREQMTQLGIPPGLQKFYIRTSLNPATRLSGRTLRDFYLYATPQQRQRLEDLRVR